MKKFLKAVCAIALTVALLCGCTTPEIAEPSSSARPNLSTDLSVYPVYANLTDDEKIIWDDICTAIKNHSTENIHIGTYTAVVDQGNAERRIAQMYQELVYSCPDYFWVNLYDFQIHATQEENACHLELEPKYLLDAATAERYQAAYDAKVDEIVSAANQIPDLFDRVLYVYDTIMANTEYDYALADSLDSSQLNLSAYGCLVEGKTVCSGYALAFRSIMEKLGIECGVEFNSYHYLSAFPGHVWNYCKLDGEYYYFDLTWDDTGFDSEDYHPYLPYSHLYFGITSSDLAKASYNFDQNAPTPECTGTQYNYFIHEGLNFETYSFDQVKPVIAAHADDAILFLRFGSYFEVEQAIEDLIDGQKIFGILKGVDRIQYMISDTDLHLIVLTQ